MNVTREVAIRELGALIEGLESWKKELTCPVALEGDKEVPMYENGVPAGLRVSELNGIDEVALRAELLLCSGKLEVLASV